MLNIDIETEDGYLSVEFYATDTEIKNDSIGSYDYHGTPYFDNQEDYTNVLSVDYYDFGFSEAEKKAADEYLSLYYYDIVEKLNELINK